MNTRLLKKYNIAAPRYTSYPTVPYWQKEKPLEAAWKKNVRIAFNENREISLYIHLPYCESLCTYCGCNKRITKNHGVEEPYIKTVLKEWEMYLQLFPEKPIIRELHLGGGTPTFFSPENLDFLMKSIFKNADIAEKHEFSFEAHPSSTRIEHLETLKLHGFNRISLGIQDVDEKILKAINRHQTYDQIKNIVIEAKKVGYKSMNFDLIFGLPFQTKENIRRNMEAVEMLLPDRIAFYSYAHVPWMHKGQRAYSEADLPKGEEKRELYELGKELLLELGYEEIGFDHFSLPSDSLNIAYKKGKLNRNFMGYTPFDSRLNIALGVSAISDSWTAFIQNEKKIEDYTKRVNQGELPFFRGHLLTKEDQILRRHILNLICRFETGWEEEELHCEGLQLAFDRMKELENDGLIVRSSHQLKVTEAGKPFVRNICLALDAHYWEKKPEGKLFSQVV